MYTSAVITNGNVSKVAREIEKQMPITASIMIAFEVVPAVATAAAAANTMSIWNPNAFGLPAKPAIWVVSSVAGTSSPRSEEHTSELQSLMRISYAVFCLKKKKHDALQTKLIRS